MNRYATAGELSASIAHELRQPLTAIAMFGNAGLNWLKRLKEQSPIVERFAIRWKWSSARGYRADDVIKSIRRLFDHKPPVKTEVNFNDLVKQVVVITAGSIKSNSIVLKMDLTEDLLAPVVMSDPIQLQQVILNLVMNAVEAISHSEHWARILQLTTNCVPTVQF